MNKSAINDLREFISLALNYKSNYFNDCEDSDSIY